MGFSFGLDPSHKKAIGLIFLRHEVVDRDLPERGVSPAFPITQVTPRGRA